MALRTVGVRLTADVAAYQRNLRAAGQSTKDFVGETDKAAKAGHLDAVADSALGVGLGLAGMAAYAISASAKFEKSMSAVSAATHASAGDMDQLRKAALQAGKDTAYSATEAADAITELSKAGIATKDVLGGGLKGALSLAAAGQMGVAEAAETAASAMTQFKLKGSDVPHIADLLAAGAGKAQGSVHDMGQALNQAGLIAAQTGLSIEDTTGTLAAFANAGLIGSDAGTSFKQMLLMLQAPSDKTKELMNELGISAYDARGQFVGITALAGQLKEKLSKLTPELRANAMAQIFGADATRAASILYEQGAEGIQSWIGKVNDAGYASETAAKLTDNLVGDLERLKGSLETMAIEGGGGANAGLRVIVQSLGALVDQFAKLDPAVGGSIVVMGALGGAAALALGGVLKLRAGLATANAELIAMGPAGAKAAAGLSLVSRAAGIAGAVFLGLEVAGAIFDKLGAASINVDKLTASLQNYAETGRMNQGITDAFGKNLEEFSLIAQTAEASTHGFWGAMSELSGIPGIGSMIDSFNESLHGTSFGDATERMKALDQSFSAFLATQEDATKAGQIWNELLLKSGLDTQQLAALLPGAWKGLQELQAKSHAAAAGQKDLAGATGQAGAALQGAKKDQVDYKSATEAATAASKGQRDALAQLSDMMKAEADPVFGLISAQDKLAKAQKAVTDAVKKHGKESDEAKAATRELAMAAIGLQGAVGALGNSFDGKMTPALYKTLRAAGLTDTQVKNLEAQFKAAKSAADKYDGNYVAKASAPGATDAKKKMADAWAQAKGFEGTYTAKLMISGNKAVDEKIADLLIKQRQLAMGGSYASAKAAVQKDLDRNRQRKATGGPVYGAGTATSDSIPALLSNGEHVLTAAEVDKMGGQGAVTSMRRAVMSGKRVEFGDETPGFALGGSVRWPMRTDVSKTLIPEMYLSGPPGGRTGPWIEAMAKAMVPGIRVISGYRPGARTLSGNQSLHALDRARDFEASEELARKWDERFGGRTTEAITPYQQYNRLHGKRHAYTGAIWNQHNFAGGNPHDHIAMKNGGTIREPVFGVGASGRTYSLGENYQPERVTPNWQGGGSGGGGNTTTINLNLPSTAGVNPVEYGRQVAVALQPYLANGGSIVVRGKTVLSGS